MSNLTVEEGDDGNIWVTHLLTGTAIAVCRKMQGSWFAAEDDGFDNEIGPFSDLDTLCKHIEDAKLFGPWDSPGA